MQLADGSAITAPKRASFRIVGEGDNVTVELISGSMRVDSKGTPISVTRGDTMITTAGGAFSAFGSQGGGLDGRTNAGTASVTAGGETRDFGKGEGYVASSDGVSGTFTPPPASSPQYASNTSTTSYSSADERGADGNSVVADEAVENTGGNPGGSVSYGGTPPITGVTVPVTGTEQTGHWVLYAADVFGSLSGHNTPIDIDAGGPACTGVPCKAVVSGFLSGNGATHAGLIYTISPAGMPGNPAAVQGSAAFVRTP